MVQVISINSDYKRSLLEGLELFTGVEPDDVADLLQACDRRDLAAGELLLSPGTPNEHVYIVLAGALNVHVGSPSATPLTTMEAGACVGEMSIIESRDPSAFVIAGEATHLLVIHQTLLWEMVHASHEFAKNLLVVMSERIRSHNRVIADSYGELRKVEQQATQDALTGLGNRHSMQAVFPTEISRCLQEGETVSLIMIDVDNFKDFNDKFGHIAGDRALKAVAAVLEQKFRPSDIIVRYGGDEFAVLLPRVGLTDATEVAERVRLKVSGTTADGSDSLIQVPVRISMGIAEIYENGGLDSLIQDADAALYRAKRAGRNTISS